MTSVLSALPKKAAGPYGAANGSSSWLDINDRAKRHHPNLGLHYAAATGNIGLVKFALQYGQPTTSVLNGILPLHAACSGGDKVTVALLLSYGADVNAGRLRAPNDAIAGIGTEGSTPLHFAAANGHSTVVCLLLEHGAYAAARDGDGFTAEELAMANGHTETTSILRSWARSRFARLSTLSSKSSSKLASRASNLSLSSSSHHDVYTHRTTVLRSQRSLDHLSLTAAGVRASLRSTKRHALAKMYSNPNLKADSGSYSSRSHAPKVPALPIHIRMEKEKIESEIAPTTASFLQNPFAALAGATRSREGKRRPSLPAFFDRPRPHHTSTDIENSQYVRRKKQSVASSASRTSGAEEAMSSNALSQTPFVQPVIPSSGTTVGSITSAPAAKKVRNSPSQKLAELRPELSDASPSSDMDRFVDDEDGSSSSFFSSSPVRHAIHLDLSSPVFREDSVNTTAPALTLDKEHSDASVPTFLECSQDPDASRIQYAPSDLTIGQAGQMSTGRERSGSQSASSISTRQSRSTSVSNCSKTRSPSRVSLAARDAIDDLQEYLADAQPCPAGLRKAHPSHRTATRTPVAQVRDILMNKDLGDMNSTAFATTTATVTSAEPQTALRSLSAGIDARVIPFAKQSRQTIHFDANQSHQTTTRPPLSASARKNSFQGNQSAAHHSESSSASMKSKISSSSINSISGGRMTASEHARAIIRSAEEGRPTCAEDGTPLTLVQMLAACGEALAIEREESNKVAASGKVRLETGLEVDQELGLNDVQNAAAPYDVQPKLVRSAPVVRHILGDASATPSIHSSSNSNKGLDHELPLITKQSFVMSTAKIESPVPLVHSFKNASCVETSEKMFRSSSQPETHLHSSTPLSTFNELRPGDWDGDVGQLSNIIKNYSVSAPSKSGMSHTEVVLENTFDALSGGSNSSPKSGHGHKLSPSLLVSLNPFLSSSNVNKSSVLQSTAAAESEGGRGQNVFALRNSNLHDLGRRALSHSRSFSNAKKSNASATTMQSCSSTISNSSYSRGAEIMQRHNSTCGVDDVHLHKLVNEYGGPSESGNREARGKSKKKGVMNKILGGFNKGHAKW